MLTADESRFKSNSSRIVISEDEAAKIIHRHFDHYHNANVQLRLLPGIYQHHANSAASYLVDVLSSDTSQSVVCFLMLTVPQRANDDDAICICNTLSTVRDLGNLVRDSTDIPIPDHKIDLSLSIVPYHYLLSPLFVLPEGHTLLSLSEAQRKGVLSPMEYARLDLRIGQYLGQLHTNVQNDWFGMPQPPESKGAISSFALPSLLAYSTPPGGDSAYSWQETFVTLFEALLARVEDNIKKSSEQGQNSNENKKNYTLPSQDIHRWLSRAIGFYLFDDVQVPCLITHTGSADDIFITIAIPSKDVEGLPPTTLPVPDPKIVYFLPNLTHAIWGDPLLETIFTPPGPSQAVREGYAGAGGGELVVFPRQKTKRLWYTLFSALLVLAEEGVDSSGNEKGTEIEVEKGKVKWAWETVDKCVEALKDAPCY